MIRSKPLFDEDAPFVLGAEADDHESEELVSDQLGVVVAEGAD